AALAAAALADELLAAARLSAANADAFSLDTGGGVDIAAEAVGATGAAVNAECEAQATMTMRVSAHRIAPEIARNTKAPDSIARGSFPISSPVVKLRAVSGSAGRHERADHSWTHAYPGFLRTRSSVVTLELVARQLR